MKNLRAALLAPILAVAENQFITSNCRMVNLLAMKSDQDCSSLTSMGRKNLINANPIHGSSVDLSDSKTKSEHPRSLYAFFPCAFLVRLTQAQAVRVRTLTGFIVVLCS